MVLTKKNRVVHKQLNLYQPMSPVQQNIYDTQQVLVSVSLCEG